MTENIRGKIIEDVQSLDFTYTYGSYIWVPAIKVWRSGEGRERTLPYIAVDFLPTSLKKFPSISDVVGWVGDPNYHRYGYCELELVNLTIYANHFHSNGRVQGRLFCDFAIRKLHDAILSRWETLLFEDNVAIERSILPAITDVSAYLANTATKRYAYSMDVYLRTNATWDKTPPTYDGSSVIAEKAEVELTKDGQPVETFRIEYIS